jgi:hypothetical protein
MPLTVRNFSFYGKDGRKLDYTTSGSITIANNGEQLIGDGEWLGKSKGVPTCSGKCSNIIGVAGNSATQALADAVLDQEYLDMSFGIIDGRILQATVTCDDVTYDTQMASGTLTGDFSFSGGKVSKIG